MTQLLTKNGVKWREMKLYMGIRDVPSSQLSMELGICVLNQVLAAGTRSGKHGLGLAFFDWEETRALGFFTRNKIKSASIKHSQSKLRNQKIRAVLINSGCANTFTGAQGIRDASQICEFASQSLGLNPDQVILLSTGIIGPRLNLDLIRNQISELIPKLENSPKANLDFARAIMTTDRVPKYCELVEGELKLGGVAKGAGMIHPELGTMICLLVTNADLGMGKLRSSLRYAANLSFNQISVDGSQSTNDSLILISLPQIQPDPGEFRDALTKVCIHLAKSIAFDGEGSTRGLEVVVRGAVSNTQARAAARSILSSNLVKASIHGASPNWGRILAALGSSGAELDESKLDLWVESQLGRAQVINKGKIVLDPDQGARLLSGKSIRLILDLNMGRGFGMGWGCDLSPEYVRLNSGNAI